MSELDSAVADRIAAHRPEHTPPFADLVARQRRQRRTRAGAGIAAVAAVGTAAVLVAPAALRDSPSPAPAIAAPAATTTTPAEGRGPVPPYRASRGGPGQQAGVADQVAYQRWQVNGQARYTIRLSKLCFCAVTDDVLVRVRDGRAVVPAGAQPYDYRSIADLFDLIFSGDYDRFTVTYDPTYGFPTRLEVDATTTAIDDEFTYTVSDYRPGD